MSVQMSVRNRVVGTAAAAMLSAGALVALAPAAFATHCFSASNNDGYFSDTVTVRNNCSSTQRVKILWAYDTDSECFSVSSGGTRSSTRVTPARWDGLANC